MRKPAVSVHKLFAILGVSTAAAMMSATPAQAHDVLVESNPEAGETLDQAPEEVTMKFSGELTTGKNITNLVQVVDENGNHWQDDDSEVNGTDLTVSLCEGMPNGEYSMAYRVIYSDGHPGEQRYTFTVDDSDAPDEAEPPEGCGSLAEDTDATADESQAQQDTANEGGESQETEQDSTGLPTWIWFVGGIGVIVVVGAVVATLSAGKKQRTQEDNAEEDSTEE